MKLTVLKIQNFKPREKPYKKSDGIGLYILIEPNGAKYWRLAYRFQGRQKTEALGVYPEVSLHLAREKASNLKRILSDGKDPSLIRNSNKALAIYESSYTFQLIAKEWFSKQEKCWTETHVNDVRRRLEKNIYPKIGHLPINSITPTIVLEAVRIIENRKSYDLAHRVLGVCGQVFRYGVSIAKCDSDPTRDLKGALTPHTQKHQNAIPPEKLPVLMKDIRSYQQMGTFQTMIGLELMTHTFVRTGELIKAKWPEFNFEKATWKIPASRMKMKREHLVPLTTYVISLLKMLKDSSESEYVFAGRNCEKHISTNTLLFALYELGYKGKMTGHGFRSVASTVLNENGFRPDIIEKQLAHLDSNKVRAAYNRAEYWTERVEMMEWWSNYLTSIQ